MIVPFLVCPLYATAVFSAPAACHQSINGILLFLSSKIDLQAVHALLTGPMKMAEYIAASLYEPQQWRHFALNVGCYTHFTRSVAA